LEIILEEAIHNAIQFHKIDVDPDLPSASTLMHWLVSLANSHDSTIEEVQYIFCTDDYLLDINKEHLGHDYYTDIITFPYKEGRQIASDIFISVDRVKENASTYKVSYQEELLRVMAHGLLHLIGFKDKTEEEAQVMRQKEEEALALYQQLSQ
jgi:probable rRNA maturation factor